MKKDMKKILEECRACMAEEGITVYLIFTSDFHQSEYVAPYFKFREYLSGFTGSAGTLLIGKAAAILWTDGRYFLQAEKELQGTEFELYRMQEPGVPSLTEYLEQELSGDDCVAFDGRTGSASFYLDLKQITDVHGARLRTDYDMAQQIWSDRPSMPGNAVYQLPENIAGLSIDRKLQTLRQKLKEKHADACFLTELSDIMWLFNIRGSDITYNPTAFSYAYISEQKSLLFLQKGTCPKEVREDMHHHGVEIGEYEAIESFIASLSGEKIAGDRSLINSRLYSCLLLKNEFISVENADLIPKAVKNERETALAKYYHEIDAVAMIRFLIYIKEHVKFEEITEYQAAEYLDRLRSQNQGFVDLSFETISAYGKNAAVVHYSADKYNSAVLKPEGMLLVDSGGQYLGATTDITRTIVLGALRQQEKEHYTAVLKGLLRLAAVKFLEGCSGENLDVLAREPIWKLGIDYRHGTGHGIGSFLNVHEGPQAFRYKINRRHPQPSLCPGMITSDEPGIYIEESHGIRLENELLCVRRETGEWGSFLGFETLTLVPFDAAAILPDRLSEEERELLNQYHRMVYQTISPYLSKEETIWLQKETREI